MAIYKELPQAKASKEIAVGKNDNFLSYCCNISETVATGDMAKVTISR